MSTHITAVQTVQGRWAGVAADDPGPTDGIIGQSVAWRDALARAAKVASTQATVCLQGESGTGKEVLARFIHRASPRRGGPFIAINCAALPEQLLESELFGFERGAFTGALHPRTGQIEAAAGGVLFLDEVSEMAPAAQAKLLRVLQEREFTRLGANWPVRANVRVIAATNRDLPCAVAEGQFRSDLFYRLNVFDIRIPPLRERREDIGPLADAFLRDIGLTLGRPAARLTTEAAARLLQHDWPGNVRELRNVLERASIVCEAGLIDTGDLSLLPPAEFVGTNLGALERQTIERVMREVRGNKSSAARQLGITRTQLYGRLRRYGLEHI
ncbi:MAG TPA: sigma 54-interacting transcriptional regulator [Vicinamibacterales bacterium]|nr:sigma 54-interacting transcriptional regulator [Vicinamibacterales bacterium]